MEEWLILPKFFKKDLLSFKVQLFFKILFNNKTLRLSTFLGFKAQIYSLKASIVTSRPTDHELGRRMKNMFHLNMLF